MIAMLAAPAASAQGFAGLGSDAEGFAMPDPKRPILFPRDHAPHPGYRVEWWYLTAPLIFDDGTPLGIQWTLFRFALDPPNLLQDSSARHVWMGHAAVTTTETHRVAERFARGGTGQAGATGQPFSAWIDDWRMSGQTPDAITLSAAGTDFRYELGLTATGPLIRHGRDGYSVKSGLGQASYYYSQPFYNASGTVDLGDGPRAVSGHGWLDREWSSQPLAKDQQGWDWFSLALDDGRKLMAFRLRGQEDFRSGTLIGVDGRTRTLTNDEIAVTPEQTHRGVPVEWRLRIPAADLDLLVSALNRDAWMETRVSYWEGPVTVSGSETGRGYLEMTGYRWQPE
ncbi:iron ABC transporter permease [Paracoccus aurantiacus]|uniref:Iron ABC transporter permease n=1 Tax=Paracoccus aurantiacus TaxID=2599412 RepID=A0A5C6S2I1_9RHOB|nr:lipocalin-like domain-containing protein [Paracoccus aurantiacus]TXB68819.1 iron ABC transporter permease [Paracoccus aurantiacus]